MEKHETSQEPSRPTEVSWERWVDRQIREGRARGAFDGLAGHGRPIGDLDRPRDELWWIRDKLRRERVSITPPAIRLRVEAEAMLTGLADFRSEAELRACVDELNERIRRANRVAQAGPPTTLAPFAADDLVERWRRVHDRR